MANLGEIFSIRLVIADFYLEKPKYGLDLCYSEFRGTEIKRVPIIRIFGANALGQKTCMHVHGVFPYFYIPYEKKEFESLNKAIYQIATGVDKAINVSLGQGSSAAQHVFKIQLVKGIPFYGYHRSEHQYLKIYMFNPRFVRRAANLLQNGAIMAKNFHPHESHVPYILQFMIDYNLYGMSFVHVPLEVVKFRRSNDDEEIPFVGLKQVQILNTAVAQKQASSLIEVDIGSNFILNRFQLVIKSNATQANPGIEAIWQDERIRRQKLAETLRHDEEKLNAIPVLEVPATQERPDIQVTESESFYRSGLLAKLLSHETSLSTTGNLSDQTLNSTLQPNLPNTTLDALHPITKEQKRKFNLRKIIGNAVYPEECSQHEVLTNASFIENHLSSNSIFQKSIMEGLAAKSSGSNRSSAELDDESAFLDDTVVDEELVMNLTQHQHVPLNATLRAEDMELLDVLQQLEEDNGHKDQIDLDSSLAPLSQPHKNFDLSPHELDKEAAAVATNQPMSDSDEESDDQADGNVHDFTMVMDDIDELLLRLTQSQAVPTAAMPDSALPQLDGADDFLNSPQKPKSSRLTPPTTPKTPKNHRLSTKKSPKRSPRTPKASRAALRYRPLPLIITSARKNIENAVENMKPVESTGSKAKPAEPNADGGLKSSLISLRKKLALTEMRRRTISSTSDLSLDELPTTSIKARKTSSPVRRIKDLNKTNITCALTPRRKSERLLKVYNVDNAPRDAESSESEVGSTNGRSRKRAVKTLMDSRRNQKTQETNVRSRNSKDNAVSRMTPKKVSEELAVEETHTEITESTEKSSINLIKPADPLVEQSATFSVATLNSSEKSSSLRSVKLKSQNRLKSSAVIENIPGAESKNSHRPRSPEPSNVRANTKNSPETLEQEEERVSIHITSKKSEQATTGTESDDEIVAASDSESDSSAIQQAKTPNLKRLHRSLRTASLLLRRSLRKAHSPLSVKHGRRSESPCSSKQTPRSNVDTNISASLHLQVTPSLHRRSSEECSEDDKLIQSFYEKSFTVDSPSLFSEVSSPVQLGGEAAGTASPKIFSSYSAAFSDTPKSGYSITPVPSLITLPPSSGSVNSAKEGTVIATPLELPPSYEEVLNGCRKFDIQPYEWQNPYYSNPDDITKQKEVGFTVLQIPGNKLNDCEEFQSVLGDQICSLTKWRRKKLTAMGGAAMMQRFRTAEQMRAYFASNRRVAITPQTDAPSKLEARTWLKAREMLKAKDGLTKMVEEDSPIKIRRQKVTMMLNEEGVGGDVDEDADCTMCSVSLTPLTPSTPLMDSQTKAHGLTPLTTFIDTEPSTSKAASAARKRRLARKSKLSLNAKLKAVEPAKNGIKTLPSSQGSAHSQTSDTSIASEVVLAELERSSFVKQLKSASNEQLDMSFGLAHATLNNTFGFKVNLENLHDAKSDIEYNYLTTVALELFVATRDDLHPNPECDEIRCIFYAIEHSIPHVTPNSQQQLSNKACGYIIVNDPSDIVPEGRIHGIDSDIDVKVVQTEPEALQALLALIMLWDPDIYAGYEIETASWGFIMERAKFLALDIGPLLSRVPTQKIRDFIDEERDSYTDLDSQMKLCGRILLDVWRLMRSEIALTSYTFENVMYHILHKRCPRHSFKSLTSWFASPCSRWIVIEYYLERVRGTLSLLNQLDLMGRTSEMAKLIGIQFYEVLSRGSQFRVESMMLRIAKPKNLVPLSPSVQQRAHMRAPEYLPLILEPMSRFYVDPVIVLDFQSLYPSMIIGYNYCFSTCLGRVEHLGQSSPFEFGASQLRVSPTMLRKLLDDDLITISPCGVVFVKSSVREGILPRMLTEILDTRQMVKQSMKVHKNNTALQRILHSRQLGLKLMANVTYGYTAANFSGRMPSVEVGDSVVAKGRETLERTIKMVQDNEKWNVKVVYGDTDSLFVLVPGRDRAEAFRIGAEIAEAATKINPHPVKLKLEKVYQPCILQTKKRYVGYMYESADQAEPVYEAKGIETVRRDGCPAVAKMLEKVLRILFETKDVSLVKQYVCRQFTKLLTGRANLQDLIFAKEFRGLNGYKPTACVPALELTRKWIQTDPRHVPRCGERVPFIIINGPPGVPLIRLVRSPHDVLANEGYKINAIYYITKAIIPPLNRCLLLIGADVNEWFTNLPRKILLTPALSTANEVISHIGAQNPTKKSTISQYFSTTNCVIECGRQTKQGVCANCRQNTMKTCVVLHAKMAKIERGFHLTQQICQACVGRVGDLDCASLDCPVLYVLEVKRRELKQISYLKNLLEEIP